MARVSIGIWASALVLTLAAPGWGALIQPEGMVDIGVVPEGGKKSLFLPIKNTGDKPVLIDWIEAGCHCSHVQITFDRIGPGQTELLPVTFDASGMAGELDRTVNVYAVGQTEPALVARYHVRIARIFEANPQSVEFGRAKPAEAKPIHVAVHRALGKGKVTKVGVNDSRVAATLQQKGDGEWDVAVGIAPDAKAGAFMAVLTIYTDDSVSSEVGVLVTGEILP